MFFPSYVIMQENIFMSRQTKITVTFFLAGLAATAAMLMANLSLADVIRTVQGLS
jgi:hypothetical protein